ncbi:MAG: acetolactate synthase large subunit [Gaiellaceae bacterium]|nr:acetolactate synthase large subunit [Gaiellaceae bacterium]
MATTGEAVVRLLEQYGTDTVFGIPGVHTLEIYRGLAASPIRHVAPRHEQGAGFMADAYSRIAGKPGVCVLITGAGVANAATPIAGAFHDSIPMLVISSDTHSRDRGGLVGPLHDLPDQHAFMRTITAESILVSDPAELPDAFARAWEIFQSGRPRPVHIGVPIDVLDLPAAGSDRLDARGGRPVADAAAVARAAAALADAKSPFVVLGGGALAAGDAAIAVAERVGAPIVTTLNGKGAVPDEHPLSLGARTTAPAVWEALGAADVVLAVGTEFSETDYFYVPTLLPPAFTGTLVRIDIDAEQLGRRPGADIGLHGDARATLTSLADALGDPRPDAAERAEAMRAALGPLPGTAPYLPFLEALREVLPADGILVADSTQPAYAAHNSWPVRRPWDYISPAGFGTLGPALPMAIGAKIAAPDRVVACLAGDGGFLFTVQELATAAEEHLALPILLWQNHGYGEIRESMDRVSVPHVGVGSSARDFVKLAEGFGCAGVRVDSLAAMQDAFRAATTADGPTLIEVSPALR